MNNKHENNDEINIQIRKFLKQVGVGCHQIINEHLEGKNANLNVNIKLEINEKEVKFFSAKIG